jgi:hypothetical protein
MTARANSSEEMMLAGSESLPADRLASRGVAIGIMRVYGGGVRRH